MHYSLGREEKTYGPYSENELRTWCEEGRISPDDLCCPVSGGDWVRVSRLFGLKEIGTEIQDYYVSNIWGINRNSLLFKLHHPKKPDIMLTVSSIGIWITSKKIDPIEPKKSAL